MSARSLAHHPFPHPPLLDPLACKIYCRDAPFSLWARTTSQFCARNGGPECQFSPRAATVLPRTSRFQPTFAPTITLAPPSASQFSPTQQPLCSSRRPLSPPSSQLLSSASHVDPASPPANGSQADCSPRPTGAQGPFPPALPPLSCSFFLFKSAFNDPRADSALCYRSSSPTSEVSPAPSRCCRSCLKCQTADPCLRCCFLRRPLKQPTSVGECLSLLSPV